MIMYVLGTFILLMLALFIFMIFSARAFYMTSRKGSSLVELANASEVSRSLPLQSRQSMALLLGMIVASGTVLVLVAGKYLAEDAQPPWDPDVVVQTITLECEVATTKGAGSTNIQLVGNLGNGELLSRAADRGAVFRGDTLRPNERVAVTVRRLERTMIVGDDDLHFHSIKGLFVLMDAQTDITSTFTHTLLNVKGKDGVSLAALAEALKEHVSASAASGSL
jgi:hypothetical protein